MILTSGNGFGMRKLGMRLLRLVVIVGGLCLAPATWAAHIDTHTLNAHKKSTKVSETQHTKRRMRHLARARSAAGHSTASARPAVASAHPTSLTRASVS